MLGVVFCDVHPVERNVEAVALRAEYIVYLRFAFLSHVERAIPSIRLGIECKRLVTSVGYGDVLLCIDAVCGLKLNSIWCCAPYRCADDVALESHLVRGSVGIAYNENVLNGALVHGRQCNGDVLALACRYVERTLNLVGNVELAVLNAYATYVQHVLAIVAKEHVVVLYRCLEHAAKVDALHIGLGFSLEVVACDVGLKRDVVACVCRVVCDNGEIVGKLACIEVVASLQCYGDVLAVAVANVAVGA